MIVIIAIQIRAIFHKQLNISTLQHAHMEPLPLRARARATWKGWVKRQFMRVPLNVVPRALFRQKLSGAGVFFFFFGRYVCTNRILIQLLTQKLEIPKVHIIINWIHVVNFHVNILFNYKFSFIFLVEKKLFCALGKCRHSNKHLEMKTLQ